MGQFVAIGWKGDRPGALAILERAALKAGWSLLYDQGGIWIAASGPRPTPVSESRLHRAIIIGDLFSRQSGQTLRFAPSPEVSCRNLVTTHWGRYVALFPDSAGSFSAVFRDPSGALDCAVWRARGLNIAASCLPGWLEGTLAMRPGLDWSVIADQLRDPTLLTGPIALEGMAAVAPGDLIGLTTSASIAIWRPLAAALSPDPHSRHKIRSTVDDAVRATCLNTKGLLVEVSGGLDSAIVASSVCAADPNTKAVWLNAWGPFAEADERSYAQAVGDHLEVPLSSLKRQLPVGSSGVCLSHPRALRPSLNRMDVLYDREQAALCISLGLDAVVTGKGGDVAFFQTAASAILADQFHAKGLRALFDPMADVLARRLRRSRWSILSSALRNGPRIGRDGLGRSAIDFSTAAVRERMPAPHPWLKSLSRLPPGKRMQVMNFTSNLALHGLCERTEAADLIHPLLSQPVMELTLGISTPVLTEGGHDRMLARRAFANRVPQSILDRRSKGELGSYYGRSIANALTELRAHLLEGRLVGAGLIDRNELEAALSAEHLIWQGGYADIMILATMESWIQAWSSATVVRA